MITSRLGPLAGLKVLDFTTFLSGPFCTQVLADLGAEVIKVESFVGDSSRLIPPHFVAGESAYFLANNRNKSSIALDLKKPEGLAVALDLIGRVDVVIENYRPGVCSRLGLDVEKIRAEHPHLIWASISGFGQEGQGNQRPAYDMIVQALAGVMSLTGEEGRPPVRLGIPAGDLVAGLYAVIGVLAAVRHQHERGEGRTLDISMLDGQLSMISYQATYSMLSGVAPRPQGSSHDSIPTYRAYRGQDGRQFVVTANTERMWRAMCDVVGVPELVEDVRFADPASRLEHRQQLDAILEGRFGDCTAEAWVERLGSAGVPVAPIRDVVEALEEARSADRDMVLDLHDGAGATVPVVGNPVRYVGEQAAPASYPPSLGQHTDSVLSSVLGLDESSIRSLHEADVVR